MQTSNLTQHLSVKNIFIAIVVLNILSAMPMSRIGGTFHEPAKRSLQAATPRASDPNMIAHFMPGEAAPHSAEQPAMAGKPVRTKSPAEMKPQPRRTSSDPPGLNWMILFAMAGMALYARYLAVQMAQTAIVGAFESVKHIAGALTNLASGGGAASKKPPAPQSPAKQAAFTQLNVPSKPAPKPKSHAAPSRKSTVVRASRWSLLG